MMRLRWMVFAALLLVPLDADVHGCLCDVARPESLLVRECSLCLLAEKQALDPPFFTIRDANPDKPDRWLALPRFHGSNPQELAGMTAAQRTAYWTVAIAKAHELWGDAWGLAVNSLEDRSQCHMHIHIGQLSKGAEDAHFVMVDGPADIPLPRDGDGIWIHPVGGKLHAHWGDPEAEFRLLP
jgi:hypothetical protein